MTIDTVMKSTPYPAVAVVAHRAGGILMSEHGFTATDIAEYGEDIANAAAFEIGAAELGDGEMSIAVRTVWRVIEGPARVLNSAIEAILNEVNGAIDRSDYDEAMAHAGRLADGAFKSEVVADIRRQLLG